MKKIFIIICIVFISGDVYGQNISSQLDSISGLIANNKVILNNKRKELEKKTNNYKRASMQLTKEHGNIDIKSLEEEIENDERKLEALKKNSQNITANLNIQKEEQNNYIDNIIKHNQKHLDKPLSKIDINKLVNIKDEFIEYRDVAYEKEALDGAISKVTTLQGYIETYNNAKQTLNVQFDKAEVDKYIDELSTCSANTILNASQQGEIENTITLLKKYEIGVDVLIYVVDYIRNRVKSTYSHNEFNFDYGRALDRIVKDTDTLAIKHGLAAKKIGELFEEYVTPIPHLKNLFNSFKKDITKNPTEQTKTEIELDGYKE